MPEPLPISDLAEHDRLGPVARDSDLGVERWQYFDGELVIEEGDRARELFVLEEGTIRIERADPDGGENRFLAMLSTEDRGVRAFGEMAFFLDGQRTASARSIGGSRVLKVGERGIPRLFAAFPDLALDLVAGLVEKLRQTSAELRSMQDFFELGAEHRFIGADDTLVYLSGDPCQTLYRVVDGSATLTLPDGATVRIAEGGPEQGFVNLADYLARRPATATAEAAVGSILVAIPRSGELAVVRNFPELIVDLITPDP